MKKKKEIENKEKDIKTKQYHLFEKEREGKTIRNTERVKIRESNMRQRWTTNEKKENNW